MKECSSMNTVIATKHRQTWKYKTDIKYGICLLANDVMQIKFIFERVGVDFYDVLEVDSEIDKALKTPVTVEGMADHLHDLFPAMRVTAKGRAASHGWISSTVEAEECYF